MRAGHRGFRRTVLTVTVFASVCAAHYLWQGLFPERDPTQSAWVAVASAEPSWWARYWANQSYWLGFSFAFSTAFGAYAFSCFLEDRTRACRNLGAGSLTFSGGLAFGSCFLLGCCGSPMLAVYVSLLGVSFLPWAKPLIAGLTTLLISLAWGWIRQRMKNRENSPAAAVCCGGTASVPDPAPEVGHSA